MLMFQFLKIPLDVSVLHLIRIYSRPLGKTVPKASFLASRICPLRKNRALWKQILTKLMKEKYEWWHAETSLLLHNTYKPKIKKRKEKPQTTLHCRRHPFLLSLQAILLHHTILILLGFVVQSVFSFWDTHSSWNDQS